MQMDESNRIAKQLVCFFFHLTFYLQNESDEERFERQLEIGYLTLQKLALLIGFLFTADVSPLRFHLSDLLSQLNRSTVSISQMLISYASEVGNANSSLSTIITHTANDLAVPK